MLTVTAVIEELLRPWRRPATWYQLGSVALGPIIGTVSFSVVITFLATTVGLLITFPLALPFAWLLFASARMFSHVQRSRLACCSASSWPTRFRRSARATGGATSWSAPGPPLAGGRSATPCWPCLCLS